MHPELETPHFTYLYLQANLSRLLSEIKRCLMQGNRLASEGIHIIAVYRKSNTKHRFHSAKENNKPGYMLMTDFQKAFNSVYFDFINTVLKLFGFGPYLTCCINIRLGNTTSRGWFNGVNVVDGHILVHFHLQRGCRQCDTCMLCVFKSWSYSLIKNSKFYPHLTSGLNPILNDTYEDDFSAYLKC